MKQPESAVQVALDEYIGRRYNSYIDIRYNGQRYNNGGASISTNQTGALTEAVYYILLAIQQPLHGYGIMQKIEQLSGGRVRLAAGTLYGAISTMLERGWIAAVDGKKDSRKKEYQITALGKKTVQEEMRRLEELLSNGNTIMGGEGS